MTGAIQSRRLLLLLAGTTMVVVGVPSTWWPLTVAGAGHRQHRGRLARRAARTTPAPRAARALPRDRPVLRRGRRRASRSARPSASCSPAQPADPWHGRLLAAHVATMALGWLGLTMTGTLVTLWPTMLRTRMDDRAERLARQSLPIFLTALVVIDTTALAGLSAGTAAGLALWLAALAWWGRALVGPLRRRPPRELGPASVGLALLWLAGGLVAAASPSPSVASPTSATSPAGSRPSSPPVSACSSSPARSATSSPACSGGGPSVVRAGQRWLEKGAVTAPDPGQRRPAGLPAARAVRRTRRGVVRSCCSPSPRSCH